MGVKESLFMNDFETEVRKNCHFGAFLGTDSKLLSVCENQHSELKSVCDAEVTRNNFTA